MMRKLPTWSVPIALLVVCLASFGLLIPQLGFYWDDWPSVYIARSLGSEGFREFFKFDRPTTYISYTLLPPLLGLNPIAWQIFTLGLRWLTSVGVWWFFLTLIPLNRKLAVWGAFLFAASPLFTQQSIAFTYHQLWMEYCFFIISLAAMLQAERTPRWRWQFTALAVLALLANLSISEYFMGLELLRGVFLLAAQSYPFKSWRSRLLGALRSWIPYLLITVGYVIWRLFLIQLPEGDRNAPTLLYSFFTSPILAAKKLLEMVLQDVSFILVETWYRAIDSQWFDLDRGFYLLVWVVSAVTAGMVCLYLLRLKPETEVETDAPGGWYKTAALLGFLAVLFGPLPGWLTGRQVSVGMYSERLAVPAMLGACLLGAALIDWLLAKERYKIIALGILVGLAVGINLRTANDYRWSWIEQKRFAWQLAWRAPSIQPGTAILADGELIRFVGHYSTAMIINLTYPPSADPSQTNFWFVNLGREYQGSASQLAQNIPFDFGLRLLRFSGRSTDSLLIFYKPSVSSCLHILGPDDLEDPSLPEITRAALPASNLKQISTQARSGYPPGEIFGSEPEHNWCYYYQKAALARQLGDWAGVISLADQASEKGYRPLQGEANTPQEWLPFVEAFARSGRADEAAEISRAIFQKDRRMDRQLCGLWVRLRQTAAGTATNQVLSELGCLSR